MKNLTFIILLLTMPSTVFSEWRFREHDKNTGITYRLDYNEIRKKGNYVYFRTLLDLSKPFDNGTNSIEQHYKVNCDELTIQWVKKYFFQEPLGEGEPIQTGNNNNPRWGHPLQGSFFDRSVRFVCEFVKKN